MDNLGEAPPEARRTQRPRQTRSINHKNGRQKHVINDDGPEDPGRRLFLKHTGKMGALAFLTSLGVKAKMDASSIPISSENQELNDNLSEEPVVEEDKLEPIPLYDGPEVFKEMFMNIYPEQADAIRNSIRKNYQTKTEEGGIGLLSEYPSMLRLLNKAIELPDGQKMKFEEYLHQVAHGVEIKLFEEKHIVDLNPNALKGLIFDESRGVEDAESPAGAVGIAQFMPHTARRFGLIDEDGNDYRTDPVKSIEAMAKYLGELKYMFGDDMGLASWAYHAGEGNVIGALRSFFLHGTDPVDIGDFGEALIVDQALVAKKQQPFRQKLIFENIRQLLSDRKVNLFQIMRSQSVQKFIKVNKLEDDTAGYAFKAQAAAEYFEERERRYREQLAEHEKKKQSTGGYKKVTSIGGYLKDLRDRVMEEDLSKAA